MAPWEPPVKKIGMAGKLQSVFTGGSHGANDMLKHVAINRKLLTELLQIKYNQNAICNCCI